MWPWARKHPRTAVRVSATQGDPTGEPPLAGAVDADAEIRCRTVVVADLLIGAGD